MPAYSFHVCESSDSLDTVNVENTQKPSHPAVRQGDRRLLKPATLSNQQTDKQE